MTIIIPPGALDANTTICVTDSENGTGFEYTTNFGNGTALFAVTLDPEGQTFNIPVTIIFAWLDDDQDGVIDGTNIQEKAATITKDNARVTKIDDNGDEVGDLGRCSQEPGPLETTGAECDQIANTFSILVDSFSEFAQFETESVWLFSGTAEGGTISFTIDGVMLVVVSAAGETAADVAANISAAINADSTLSDLGIIATNVGGVVTTNGLVSSTDVNDPGLTHRMPPGAVDHYKVYSLQPESVSISGVLLEDQFGTGSVNLTNLEKLGAPVSKTIAPNSPSGFLLRPDEHLAWYAFFEAHTPLFVRVKNQFEGESKGAIWDVGDGRFLLVPAIKDGLGAIQLGQHWKCYDAFAFFDPNVTVNLLDQFHLESNVVVGSGRYLCNPVEKNNEGPPSFPNEHLACYDIVDLPLSEPHSLNDQFGNHPGLMVENPELLCVPSLKYLPEPGVLLPLGSGLMLLGWLDHRRRRRAIRP